MRKLGFIVATLATVSSAPSAAATIVLTWDGVNPASGPFIDPAKHGS